MSDKFPLGRIVFLWIVFGASALIVCQALRWTGAAGDESDLTLLIYAVCMTILGEQIYTRAIRERSKGDAQ